MAFRPDLSPFPGLEDVIGEIYDLAFAEEGMPRLLELMSRMTASRSAILCQRGADGSGVEMSWGIDPAYDVPMARFMHQNLLAQRMHLVQVDDPVCDIDLIRREDWRGLELYEEVWKPAGLHQCLGILFVRDRGGISSLAFFRPGEDGCHGSRSRRVAGILSPHLRRAVKLRAMVEGARARADLFEDALDHLALPLLVVDAARRLIHANRSGEEALHDSPQLMLSFGKLAAHDPADRGRLNTVFDSLARGIGASAALGTAGPWGTWLLASPLPEARAAALGYPQRERLSLIVLRDGRGPAAADGSLLRSLFDLSPAEAELALALGRGLTLAQFSAARRVSLNTARTQLKALFAKTGAARQAELARMLAGLGVVRR
ncbi:helix-turn-helix transcriptional regulator [Mangrovicoccus ximenensis]|uniref:helix-turn-helix transcriptional regulator n=1 Tax=Mangrovicoccus ximenensis TaxID=1911570 RepID=UPI000D3C1616|nr:hypothetical protein [Mangrovicoccus ximenensis]